jgi:carbamoyl-phosphate synthase large subunit
MPRRNDIASILIIGAGPIIIGQACEFDYSGAQACKALKADGYRVILVNSNPATIMTDPEMADATYIEPITPQTVAKIIEAERPDALLPTMGGQTALNTALALYRDGTLAKYGVEMIGARTESIEKAEDRELFRIAMEKIGVGCARASTVNNFDDALVALEKVGLPAIIRPSFTLGGEGGGIAYNRAEFETIVGNGLRLSPVSEVLIEESLLGWKEFEMEVVRDTADNCIIVCSIENVDPMGVHTGDSMTVAPALTLTDKEYQSLRDISIAVLREIGVDTGGSNVQFAICPKTGRIIVIEMNPRVSRSSALASKATGFPIAKVAAKLAVGYRLDELANDITGVTPASFEPTIDYIVTKIPRFTFEKFAGAEPFLSTSMKSVGEAMAVGRSFEESLQKALRSMETGLAGLDPVDMPAPDSTLGEDPLRGWLGELVPYRVLRIAMAIRSGMSLAEINAATGWDIWFLERLAAIIEAEQAVIDEGLPDDAASLRHLKSLGFSDTRLAALANTDAVRVRQQRYAAGVVPAFKRIDTCAAEFASDTAYMYSTYEPSAAGECEANPSNRPKVVILGGGPNRIGQGIEFDYCCVHACYALSDAGYETIMINCNPETVSTDYDTSDRLYFEPLTEEDVISVIRRESENGDLRGVIVQLGGQTPLKIAAALEAEGIPILGTSPDAIDLAEDRERFQKLLQKLDLLQPENGIAHSAEEARAIVETIGLPVVIRPSYVLGGRAMEIVYQMADLERYMRDAVVVSGKNPVLIDRFLNNAVEVDVDALCDGTDVYIGGIMEHIEEAGIHSGDSACSLPPQHLSDEILAEIRRQTTALAFALKVVGLMNVQFAIREDKIYLLEVNPRGSRTVPFVAKTTGVPLAKIASRVMAGEKLASFALRERVLPHVAVKEAVFPFARFPGVDIFLGPEMKSTGEVMGIDSDFGRAFAKSQQGAGVDLPLSGTVFISVKDEDKAEFIEICRGLVNNGFDILATGGTTDALQAAGVPARRINKVMEGRPHAVDAMLSGDIQLVFNTAKGAGAIKDSFSLRQTALTNKIPYYTTVSGARAAAEAIRALQQGRLDVRTLQDYLAVIAS